MAIQYIVGGAMLLGQALAADSQRDAAKKAANAKREAAEYQYDINVDNAEAARRSYDLNMDKMALAARQYHGTQMATAAANGIKLGDGSIQTMLDFTDSLAARDLYLETVNRDEAYRAAMTQADLYRENSMTEATAIRRSGDASATQTYIGMLGSIYSFGSNEGWF